MVNLFLTGYIPIMVSKHDQMNSYGCAVETHATIAASLAVTRGGTSPDVTWAGHIVEHEAEVHNRNSGHDLGKDVLFAIMKHYLMLIN